MESEIVTLKDEQGRSLSCIVEKVLPVEDEKYLLLQPVDPCVYIFGWEGEGEESALKDLDDEEIDVIFPTAQAVLAELNLNLLRTAFSLTVEGDIPEPEEEDIYVLNEDEETYEELQQLASFFHEEQEYAIFVALEPMIFFAKYNDRQELEILGEEELENLQMHLEALMLDEAENA
ncbi:MAG: DUF3727 domain-containing protein [Pseudanabaenaceae cyanobacterium SKYGB_i_bin29]|nr:DUF3727 domain-containing protein [Pseudanabaenaceae cyanobacterium SKYG29]MDW8421265.1 DUF3727 domain-containing protein [Pseudanabaenaceae cyanobacterium SKYGB_i_bin29]